MDATDLIKQAREHRRMTQQATAAQLGMTVQHYGAIERGVERGSDDAWAAIAQLLSITPEQLEDAGRDKAADLLRQLPGSDEADGNLDDVVILQTILKKLTVGEVRWIVDHADALGAFSSHHRNVS